MTFAHKHIGTCRRPLSSNRPSLLCRSAAVAPAAISAAKPVSISVGEMHHLEAANGQFDDFLAAAGSTLVVVDVFTQWCGPCKMIAPELEAMAKEYGVKVVMAKIDCTTDNDNKKWAMSEKVKALPTFIMYKEKLRIGDMTGAKASNLRKLIETHM
eukprot:CAMPEP_0119107896 /NCGR_PEP_ID=MMETSP1180-20130426/12251_1 /TAXON_ID=3052 ORGANISM="Chlamydomonas cf sp, Strain CCMP681" /NCGR_SAMPLE_ID=MMETSP1180 /ASSEMBLY_ACC=CAM_ASM_000741 /LENGTH=155 /DNA_ID=CAMNT_0007093445 /DNA_START=40 /DNA_END=507 /DNA_ORIENTATION=+